MITISTGLIVLLGQIVSNADPKETQKSLRPLENILKNDGSLDLDAADPNGSYNTKGWNLLTDSSGNPRFVRKRHVTSFSNRPASIAGDEDWDDSFGLPGVDGYVYALAIDGEGNVYVGGSFTVAGNQSANYIAKWDGSDWDSLGSGMNGTVFTIAIDGDNIYAGGLFTQAGGNSARHVAVWDGSVWNSLGSGPTNGVNSIVYAIAVIDHDVYVGGDFTEAGGNSTIRYIAKWNGTSWTDVGSGVNAKVNALTVDAHDNLYAGGDFTVTGGGNANRVAKWNGSSWSALGLGIDDSGGSVYALGIKGDLLFVGGFFNKAGGLTGVSNIAKCDTNGNNWSAVGGGVDGDVKSIAVIGTDVYAGGVFGHAGVFEANRIAKWNGSSWSALGQGVNSTVSAVVGGTDVYVAGFFDQAGDVGVSKIAKWNGSSWSSLNTNKTYGSNGSVYVITVDGINVYVGGGFTVVGGVLANHIAKWNGAQWYPLGNGVDNIVNDIIVNGSNVYACGEFEVAGGIIANHVAKWNGSSWSQVGQGLNASVISMTIKNGTLYAGGAFIRSGSIPMNYLAKFSGSNWSAFASEVNDVVYALDFKGDSLFVGGSFTEAGGDPSIQYLAKCDTNGNGWAGLGSGVDGVVETITVNGSDVYIGGMFSTAGGNVANNIAKWDGGSWSSLGTGSENGVDDEVYSICVSGTNVYVGGAFIQAGSTDAYYIAKYDGSGWNAFGSGLNSYVYAIGEENFYVGGDFSSAGGKPSYYIAHYGAESQMVQVEIKIFLEGPYYANGDTMRTNLKRNGYIPSTSPYADGRSATVPDDVVDWIYVQLRTSPAGTAVASKSAFLNSDGRIVADDGTTGQIALDVAEGNYYIVVDHRNHLRVMSANPVALSSGSSMLYDFTISSTQFYGSGGVKQLESDPEVWGMWAGDGNQDGGVYGEDYTLYQLNQGKNGYECSDFNLDGGVYGEDYTLYQLNQGKNSMVPE